MSFLFSLIQYTVYVSKNIFQEQGYVTKINEIWSTYSFYVFNNNNKKKSNGYYYFYFKVAKKKYLLSEFWDQSGIWLNATNVGIPKYIFLKIKLYFKYGVITEGT